MNILLTGYSGFLGGAVSRSVSKSNLSLISRRTVDDKSIKNFVIKNFDECSDFKAALRDVSVVIHCAALVHGSKNKYPISLEDYISVNTKVTLSLAKQASEQGVCRFIFISSIGVNGSSSNEPFKEIDPPNPHNYYCISKYKAEAALLELSRVTDMEVVIIRSPLVYGPNAPGSFAMLLGALRKGIPLPLASVKTNRRSFIALDNLVDFILFCSDYKKTPNAANEIFVISDSEDISTAELCQKIASAHRKTDRLFSVPVLLLRLGAKILGKKAVADQLFNSLQVDSSKARNLLGWKPVVTMDEQLRKIAEVDGYIN